jgi:hypothetical protein
MNVKCAPVVLMAFLSVSTVAGAVDSFTAVCTQTEGKRYQHLRYEDEQVGGEWKDSVAKDNTWKDEKLFVSNPVSLRYVAGEQIVLVDEKFPFRITTQDETKLAFVQVDDDESAYNQNTYLLDLKSMKAAYSRLRIYRGSLPGIMAGQFSLDCKVSYRR